MFAHWPKRLHFHHVIISAENRADRREDPNLLGVNPDPSDLLCILHFERGMGFPISIGL
jgi:hypothetical protein